MQTPEVLAMTRRRGFSLLEILVAVSLLALLVGLAVSQQPAARRRATAEGLAQVVGQHLRNAQSLALLSGTPVALVFPSGGGSTPFSQGCYRISGRQGGRISQVVDFSKDFPGFSIFLGAGPRGGQDGRPAVLGLEDDGFQLSSYQLPYPQDFALIFLASGQVVSNGVPHHQGDYQLVVCQGGEVQAASYPQPELAQLPPCYQLGSAHQPWTITLSSLGQVRTQAGGPGGVQLSEQARPVSIGPLPGLTPPVSQLPRLLSLAVFPDPAQMPRPTGVDSLVPRDGLLTLEASAESPQGLDLFVRLEDVSNSHRGASSSDRWSPMVWDAPSRRWRGQCYWRPPSDCSDQERFQVQLRVKDAAGNLSQIDQVAGIELQVTVPHQRMHYWPLALAGTQNMGLHAVEEDATRNRRITNPPETFQDVLPSISPDGQHIAYHRRNMPLPTINELRIVTSEGSDDRALVRVGEGGIVEFRYSPVGWSPSGNRIAFTALTANTLELFSVAPDGSGLTNLSQTPDFQEFRDWVSGGTPDLAWTEDEQFLITCQKSRSEEDSHVVRVAADGSGVSRIYPGSEFTTNPSLSPGLPSDQSWLVCLVHTPPRPQYFLMKLDGSEVTPLGVYCAIDLWHRAIPFSQHHNYATISPDSRRIAVLGCDAGGNGRGLYEGPKEGPLQLVKPFAIAERMRYLQYLDPSRLSYQMPDGQVWLREVGSSNERALLDTSQPEVDASSWCLAP